MGVKRPFATDRAETRGPPLESVHTLRTDLFPFFFLRASLHSMPVSQCHGASRENMLSISDISLSAGRANQLYYMRTECPALLFVVSILPVKVRKMKQSYKGSRCGNWNSGMRQEISDPLLSNMPVATTQDHKAPGRRFHTYKSGSHGI